MDFFFNWFKIGLLSLCPCHLVTLSPPFFFYLFYYYFIIIIFFLVFPSLSLLFVYFSFFLIFRDCWRFFLNGEHTQTLSAARSILLLRSWNSQRVVIQKKWIEWRFVFDDFYCRVLTGEATAHWSSLPNFLLYWGEWNKSKSNVKFLWNCQTIKPTSATDLKSANCADFGK